MTYDKLNKANELRVEIDYLESQIKIVDSFLNIDKYYCEIRQIGTSSSLRIDDKDFIKNTIKKYKELTTNKLALCIRLFESL